MRRYATDVARIAQRAGFVGDAIRDATALALATSSGLPTYDYDLGVPGAGRYVGLWGIDVDRHPDYADHDLYVPQINAQAAYDLTSAHGGFHWSPVWRAGIHPTITAAAGVGRTREYETQPLRAPMRVPGLSHATTSLPHRLDALRRRHGIRPIGD